MSLLEIVPVRPSLIGNSPIRNPARDPNLEGAHRSGGREGESRAIAALPPCLPQILDRFLFPPSPSFPLASPPLRIPPSSLQSSLFLPALSNVHWTREQVSFANAFGDDGEKGARVLACPFPAARTRQPSFMMIFTIEEHSLCLWIHISRTSNSVGFRSPTQFELAFKSSPSSSSLTELGPLFRHSLLSVFLRLVPRVHFSLRLSFPSFFL